MSNQSPGEPFTSYERPVYQEPAHREFVYLPPPTPPWGARYAAPQIIIVRHPTNGKAVASMVLGICLIVALCSLLSFSPAAVVIGLGTGLSAVILGHMSLKEINQSQNQQSGKEMAIAGLVLGYITLGVALVFLVAFPAASQP